MAGFFHGISISETLAGGVTIQTIKAAVIGLVGSAPTWAGPAAGGTTPPQPNTPYLVNSRATLGACGPLIQGYTIPYALNHILDQSGPAGVGQAIVVNVFNPLLHNSFSSQVASMPPSGAQYISVVHMGLVGPGLPNLAPATASTATLVQIGGRVAESYAAGGLSLNGHR